MTQRKKAFLVGFVSFFTAGTIFMGNAYGFTSLIKTGKKTISTVKKKCNSCNCG